MTPNEQLENITQALETLEPFIKIDAELKLTKTTYQTTKALFSRDMSLELSTAAWVDDRLNGRGPGATPGYTQLLSGYLQYDRQNLKSLKWPKHYPARIIAGYGPVCSGSNVFVFFPEALGLPASPEGVFGIEFIDVWSNAFDNSIAPCVRRIFDIESQILVFKTLTGKFGQTSFLASLFHEIGHRVGPVRVSPEKDKNNKLDSFNLDTIGELSTDTLLSTILKDFPEVVLYVVLTRILWYARQGFADSPQTARINIDNDAWTGAYLWQRLEHCQALTRSGKNGRWHLDYALMEAELPRIRKDVHDIADQALKETSSEDQNRIVDTWLSKEIGGRQNGLFHLPKTLGEVFQLCQGIPERPPFSPSVTVPLDHNPSPWGQLPGQPPPPSGGPGPGGPGPGGPGPGGPGPGRPGPGRSGPGRSGRSPLGTFKKRVESLETLKEKIERFKSTLSHLDDAQMIESYLKPTIDPHSKSSPSPIREEDRINLVNFICTLTVPVGTRTVSVQAPAYVLSLGGTAVLEPSSSSMSIKTEKRNVLITAIDAPRSAASHSKDRSGMEPA